MNLQNFVTAVIDTLGGLVDPLEYALCQVMIPEEHKDLFQGKTQLILAFDFEVAEENPTAEFVTFGSYILDQLIEFIKKKTISSVRYIVPSRLVLSNVEDKIKKYINLDRGKIQISSERLVLFPFAAFNFAVGYTSEERTEVYKEIWVDLVNNKVSKSMEQNKNGIFFDENINEVYPTIEFIPITQGFQTAFNETKTRTEIEKLDFKDDMLLNNELKRIDDYYQELLKENNKKMQRKGTTEDKIKELESKAEALMLEKQRQLKELTDKYSIIVDVSLDYGIIYFLPVIEYTFTIESNHTKETQILFYNSIAKDFI